MILRCDNCSVSLQLDDSKIPDGKFTVRCPRCQNMIRITPGAGGAGSATVQQLASNVPAPAVNQGAENFSARESELQINSAMRSLLSALQTENRVMDSGDDDDEMKPRRVLLCLGSQQDRVSRLLVESGYKVYLAENPSQANERMREGKTGIVIFSPDFAAEMNGATVLHQKFNAMAASERRRVYLVSLEDEGNTLNAHGAFLRNLNLIVNENDVDELPLILKRALRDFNDLYFDYNVAAGLAAL